MNKKEKRLVDFEINKVKEQYENEQDLIVALVGHYNSGEFIQDISLIKLMMRLQDYMSKFEILSVLSNDEYSKKHLDMEEDYNTIFEIVEQQLKKECRPSKVQHSNQ